MQLIYNIGIYLYAFVARILALWDSKARLWVHGQHAAFARLENFAKSRKNAPLIWFHAASLGEFEQARPVIEAIRKDHPEYIIALTFFSPSGYEIRKNYDQVDFVGYMPIDKPRNARRFIKTLKPEICIFVKYEFWMNYIQEIKKSNAKIYFISAIFRSSQHFFKPYGTWFRKKLHLADLFFVQNESSKKLLHTIGIKHVVVSGDTRFDRVVRIANTQQEFPVIEKFKQYSKLFLAGSSWPEDEELIKNIISEYEGTLKFVFAPHEVHDAHIRQLQEMLPVKSLRLSEIEQHNPEEFDILIIDQIGILSMLYRYADFAYIGGGFGKGIHNILEAATFGKPIFFGPNYYKFQEAIDLVNLGGAFPVKTTFDLQNELTVLLEDHQTYTRVCEASAHYVQQNKGATEIILKNIFG